MKSDGSFSVWLINWDFPINKEKLWTFPVYFRPAKVLSRGKSDVACKEGSRLSRDANLLADQMPGRRCQAGSLGKFVIGQMSDENYDLEAVDKTLA